MVYGVYLVWHLLGYAKDVEDSGGVVGKESLGGIMLFGSLSLVV